MRNKRVSPLILRLIAWFLILSIVPLVVMTVFNRRNVGNTILEIISLDHSESAQILASELDRLDNPEEIRNLLTSCCEGFATDVFVTDLEGTILYHPNLAQEGSPALQQLQPDLRKQLLVENQPVVIDRQNGIVIAAAPIPSQNALAIIYNDEEEVLLSLNQLERTSFSQLLASLVIVSIAAGIVLWVVVGRSVRTFTRAAEQIAAGDLNARVNTEYMDDELLVLGNTFNGMVDQLQELFVGLEEKIEQLTRIQVELKQSRLFVQRIAETIPGLLYVYDIDKRQIIFKNREMIDLEGSSAIFSNILTRSSLEDAIHPDDISVLMNLEDRYKEDDLDRDLIEYEYRVLSDDGEYIWVRCWETVFSRDQSGNPSQLLGIIQNVHPNKLNEIEREKRIRRFVRQQSAMFTLAKDETIIQGDVSAAAAEITVGVADAMQLDRVGVWLLSKDKEELILIDAYDRMRSRHMREGLLHLNEYPNFYSALCTGRVIVAPDAGSDQRTKELATQLLQPQVIRSMIVAGVWVRGEIAGAISLESLDAQRRWYADEIAFAGAVADQASLMLLNKERIESQSERERLLAQVQEQAHQVRQIMNTVPEGLLLLDANGYLMMANPAAEQELPHLLDEKNAERIEWFGDRLLDDLLREPENGDWHEVHGSGRVFEVASRAIENSHGKQGWVLVLRDVTRDREVQDRIQQQERLAAVGQLAAGIAHDFNNIMAVIMLYTEMMLSTDDLPPSVEERLQTVYRHSVRAGDLIQQILDFSRSSVLERARVDLLPLMKEQVKMLERTLPENIQIKFYYTTDEYTVKADPTRIQQAVMNLAVNARDAMPEGGVLELWLSKVPADKKITCIFCGELEKREWVRIDIKDTGDGIPEDILPHIFEPFFTTKEVGKGTGLGLSQVYGTVKQHDGHLDVRARTNVGTVFSIILPYLPSPSIEPIAEDQKKTYEGEGELILVVEDDAATREALFEGLRELGYRVIQAENGRQALTTLDEDPSKISLVISDAIMPDMGGKALLQAMTERKLKIPVILLTGHPLMNGEFDEPLPEDTYWLQKPASLEKLGATIASVLNR